MAPQNQQAAVDKILNELACVHDEILATERRPGRPGMSVMVADEARELISRARKLIEREGRTVYG